MFHQRFAILFLKSMRQFNAPFLLVILVILVDVNALPQPWGWPWGSKAGAVDPSVTESAQQSRWQRTKDWVSKPFSQSKQQIPQINPHNSRKDLSQNVEPKLETFLKEYVLALVNAEIHRSKPYEPSPRLQAAIRALPPALIDQTRGKPNLKTLNQHPRLRPLIQQMQQKMVSVMKYYLDSFSGCVTGCPAGIAQWRMGVRQLFGRAYFNAAGLASQVTLGELRDVKNAASIANQKLDATLRVYLGRYRDDARDHTLSHHLKRKENGLEDYLALSGLLDGANIIKPEVIQLFPKLSELVKQIKQIKQGPAVDLSKQLAEYANLLAYSPNTAAVMPKVRSLKQTLSPTYLDEYGLLNKQALTKFPALRDAAAHVYFRKSYNLKTEKLPRRHRLQYQWLLQFVANLKPMDYEKFRQARSQSIKSPIGFFPEFVDFNADESINQRQGQVPTLQPPKPAYKPLSFFGAPTHMVPDPNAPAPKRQTA
jgi:hypothetical protein